MHRATRSSRLVRLATGGTAMAAATCLTMLGAPVAHAQGEAELTITPNQLSGPCEGLQLVDFSVTGFVPDEPVAFTLKSPTGYRIGTVVTDDTGAGGREFKFNTGRIPPHTYTFWASQNGGETASATFTETTCD